MKGGTDWSLRSLNARWAFLFCSARLLWLSARPALSCAPSPPPEPGDGEAFGSSVACIGRPPAEKSPGAPYAANGGSATPCGWCRSVCGGGRPTACCVCAGWIAPSPGVCGGAGALPLADGSCAPGSPGGDLRLRDVRAGGRTGAGSLSRRVCIVGGGCARGSEDGAPGGTAWKVDVVGGSACALCRCSPGADWVEGGYTPLWW
jgi:hypothetical protein